MTELLFEGYSAPAVAYGLDSLWSLYANSPDPTVADGLVISSGTANTHVIPVLGGKAIMTSAKKCVPVSSPLGCRTSSHRRH